MPSPTYEEIRRYYDRFGARQDRQGYYEDPATRRLVEHGVFREARAVLEFGCGTGRLAEELLRAHLPPHATYLGLDLSPTMVALASARLSRFGGRAAVRLTTGPPKLEVADASRDRVVSTFVLDLLTEADQERFLSEARRALMPGGLLCLASLTHGFTFWSRSVALAIRLLYAVKPTLVGGCRPIAVASLLDPRRWVVRCRDRLAPYGIPLEVVVAERGGGRDGKA